MHAQAAPDDNRLLRSIPATRVALIERIARAVAPASKCAGGSRDLTELHQRFVKGYFRGVGEEDLTERTPGLLARMALDHFEFGVKRAPGQSLVRVFNPDPERDGFDSPHTLVLTVTDDMPFLVDSLSIVFKRAELAVHLIVHPVLEVRRDGRGRLSDVSANGNGNGTHAAYRAESWQLYEIDRQTDPAQIEKIQHNIEATLADVRASVADWSAMREQARSVVSFLENTPQPVPADDVAEARHLLGWMEARHFVFLGYRHYTLERGAQEDRLVPDPRSGLGILRDGKRRRKGAGVTVLRGDIRAKAREPELLILTKANSTSTVHRDEYLDYVGVKTFDARGKVSGEHRFLGLWTSTAYHGSPRDIPVLRRKVERVVQYFGLDPQSHDGKAVLNVLETYPRDELFQANVDDLIRIARSVVNLYERRTVRLLVRRDPYHRFYSCLVYVPRDRYNTEVRQRIEQIVLEGFEGKKVESYVQISGSNHARVHVVVRTDPEQRRKVDFAAIENKIAEAALTWTDRLREVLAERKGEAAGLLLATRYRRAFPMAYEEDVTPADALQDLADLDALREHPQAMRLKLHRPTLAKAERVHLKIVKLGDPVPISDLLPMLENFGLRVISERPYELVWPEGGAAWIQDFELEHRERLDIENATLEANFKDAFAAAWSGEVENDGFNRLLFGASLNAREITVLRAYCRYLLQTGVPFSQASMERTLGANIPITRNLVRLFETHFDPATAGKAPGNGAKPTAHRRGHGRESHRAQRREADRPDPRRSRQGHEPRRRPHPAGVPGPRAGHAADQLLPTGHRRQAEELRFIQVRSQQDPGPAATAPEVRDLHLQPESRRRPPADGLRRSRRHPLVRPARGLPHRGPGPDEGAERQKHAHRAGWRQGRLRSEAPADRRHARGDPGGGRLLLPDFHPRPPRPDRQHRVGAHDASAAGRPPRRR